MIVVIEGARGVGKTTLAKALVFALNACRVFDPRLPSAKYEKFTRTPQPHEDMHRQINEMMADGRLHVVDRFHITEFVMEWWRTSSRNKGALLRLDTERAEIAQRLVSAGALVYVLTADSRLILRRIMRRRDSLRRGDIDNFIISAFSYAAFRDNVPLIRNNTRRDMIANVSRIVHDIRKGLPK
jgi:thymidylate kinase